MKVLFHLLIFGLVFSEKNKSQLSIPENPLKIPNSPAVEKEFDLEEFFKEMDDFECVKKEDVPDYQEDFN